MLRDPATVLQREFGVTLPAEVTVQVVAEDAHTQYLVLPPALDDMELTDEQLELVAGGEIFFGVAAAVTAAMLAAGVIYMVVEGV